MHAYKIRFDATQITQEDIKQWLADWTTSHLVVYEVSYSKSKWFRGDSNLNPHYQGIVWTHYTERQIRCKSRSKSSNGCHIFDKPIQGILSYIQEGGNRSYSIGNINLDTVERYIQYLCKGTRKNLPLVFSIRNSCPNVPYIGVSPSKFRFTNDEKLTYHKQYWEEYDHNTKPKVYGLEKMFQELDFKSFSERDIGKTILSHYLEMWKTVPPPAILKSLIRFIKYKHTLLENPKDHNKIMDAIFEEIYYN